MKESNNLEQIQAILETAQGAARREMGDKTNHGRLGRGAIVLKASRNGVPRDEASERRSRKAIALLRVGRAAAGLGTQPRSDSVGGRGDVVVHFFVRNSARRSLECVRRVD